MSHLDEGQLHALLDGELTEAERSQAEVHLAACPECRQALAEAKAFFQEADALIARVELPPASAGRSAAPAPVRRRWGFRWQQLAWAATVVLAVGLGWFARSDQLMRSAGESDVAAAPASVPAPERDSARPAEETLQGVAAEDKVSGDTRRKPESVAPQLGKQVAPGGRREAPAQPAPVTEPATAPSPPAARQAEAARENQAGAVVQAPLDTLHEKALADADQLQRARADDAALESRRAAPVSSLVPSTRDESLRGLAAPSASRPTASPLRPVPMEEAVRILGGSIRLVDGMTPARILAGEANPASTQPPYLLVRVVYDDPPGRELWLDQQRPAEAGGDAIVPGRGPVALLPGDTVMILLNHGSRSLRWLDQAGFRLGLTGFLPTDSLRVLARRVQ